MSEEVQVEKAVEVHPVTPARWADLEALFGPRGAVGGCWCMYWRLRAKDYEAGLGDENRAALHALVAAGREPGLLAYVAGQPAGWCSLGPRETFPRFARSRTLQPIDDRPVWSIVCFFVDRRFRRRGLMGALLQAAVAYAREHGARIVEGYPIDPGEQRYAEVYSWTGYLDAFRAAGFVEVARRSEKRPIMRLHL